MSASGSPSGPVPRSLSRSPSRLPSRPPSGSPPPDPVRRAIEEIVQQASDAASNLEERYLEICSSLPHPYTPASFTKLLPDVTVAVLNGIFQAGFQGRTLSEMKAAARLWELPLAVLVVEFGRDNKSEIFWKKLRQLAGRTDWPVARTAMAEQRSNRHNGTGKAGVSRASGWRPADVDAALASTGAGAASNLENVVLRRGPASHRALSGRRRAPSAVEHPDRAGSPILNGEEQPQSPRVLEGGPSPVYPDHAGDSDTPSDDDEAGAAGRGDEARIASPGPVEDGRGCEALDAPSPASDLAANETTLLSDSKPLDVSQLEPPTGIALQGDDSLSFEDAVRSAKGKRKAFIDNRDMVKAATGDPGDVVNARAPSRDGSPVIPAAKKTCLAAGPVRTLDLECLRPGAWLHDAVIYAALERIAIAVPHRFEVFDPLLLGQAASVPKRTAARLQAFEETILVPMNLHAAHWVLGAVHRRPRSVRVYDSRATSGTLSAAIGDTLSLFFRRYLPADEFPDAWTVEGSPSPQQPNSHDCGIAVIFNALFLVSENVAPAEGIDWNIWRLTLAWLLGDADGCSVASALSQQSLALGVLPFEPPIAAVTLDTVDALISMTVDYQHRLCEAREAAKRSLAQDRPHLAATTRTILVSTNKFLALLRQAGHRLRERVALMKDEMESHQNYLTESTRRFGRDPGITKGIQGRLGVLGQDVMGAQAEATLVTVAEESWNRVEEHLLKIQGLLGNRQPLPSKGG